MVLRYLAFILFNLPLMLLSQQIIVHGSITDKASGSAIEGVYVKHHNKVVKTNEAGIFSYRVNELVKGEEISFQHINYEEESITLKNYYLRRVYKDTLFLDIKLKEKQFELPEVAVYAEHAPDTVFGSPEYSVEDFIITDKGLILLAYEKTLAKGSRLLITDATQSIQSALSLDFYAIHLYTDYNHQHYVVGEHSAYRIQLHNDSILLTREEDEVFKEFTQRIIDSVYGKYYFTNYQDIYPAFNFYSLKAKDSVAQLLHAVKDDFMMELYLSEFKYVKPQEKLWAVRQEAKTGIDKEIWIGAKYFTHSLYYKPVYAPMAVFGDTAYIFDHYKDKLLRVDCRNDQKLDSTSITYHHAMGKDKWKQPLIFDDALHKAYALFQNKGNLYLRKINLETGQIDLAIQLYYRYVHKVSVHNGYAYYIYRPFESAQKKFIYREKID